MDRNILKATQQWAQANGIDSVKSEKVLDNMDMSDFLVYTDAIKTKNYDVVGQLYNRASANIMESFKYFNGDKSLFESEHPSIVAVNAMSYSHLYEAYSLLPSATTNVDLLSMATMKALVYENLGVIKPQATMQTQKPTNPASQFLGMQTDNEAPDSMQQKVDQLSAPTTDMQVKIPTDQSGGQGEQIVDVDGVDIDPYNPEEGSVVVKDPSMGNEINVIPIADVQMLDDQGNEQQPELDEDDGFDMNRMSQLAGI